MLYSCVTLICSSRPRYKFLELRYRRVEKERAASGSGSASASAVSQEQLNAGQPRVDTTVFFVPDVWSVVPTKLEFEGLQSLLKKQLDGKLDAIDRPTPPPPAPVVKEDVPAQVE